MAKGYDKNKQRQDELNWFGKDLARRSKSSCELCENSGVPLSVFEVSPIPQEPEFENCIFICDKCREQLERPKSINSDYWRFISSTVWSEIQPVQVLSVRMAQLLAKDNPWASDILEQIFLDEETQEWVNSDEI